MRNAFAAAATELAVQDSRFVLLSGDIGNQLFDKYKAAAPARFFNCGVAEQNLIGVAAGMAMNGLRPIAYTITPFITSRCFEQIRVDICYHNVPVTVVGVGAGLSYASLGATHHACEDVAILRSLPNMTVVCPADPDEVTAVMRQLPSYDRPVYIRLGKKGEPKVHSTAPQFNIGNAIKMAAGSDIAVLACGTIMPEAIEAVKLLGAAGVSAELHSFHTVKPLDVSVLKEAFSSKKLVVTIEEHSLIGGFGAAVAEWFVDQKCNNSLNEKARLLRIGTPDKFLYEAGEQEHARHVFYLQGAQISKRILEALG